MTTSRLGAADWEQAGLEALARDGAAGLKADCLAKAMGVSRGSFYWHFANLDAFHQAVLRRWQESATDAIIRRLARAPSRQRLPQLLSAAFRADPSREIAIRAWATRSDDVRRVVDRVDAKRIAYLEELLLADRISHQDARTRARVLYWTYIGRSLSDGGTDEHAVTHLLHTLMAFATPERSEPRRIGSAPDRF